MPSGRSDRGAVIQRYLAATITWGHHTAQRLGLSSTELATLIQINQGEATQAALVRVTGLSPAAVSRMVDRLVERGFVTREADPADRRRVLLRQTGHWQHQIDTIIEPHRAAMRAIFGELGPERADAVLDYMIAATPVLTGLGDGEGPPGR